MFTKRFQRRHKRLTHRPPLWLSERVARGEQAGAFVRQRLASHPIDARDPWITYLLGLAADAIYSQDLALPFLTAAVDQWRKQGLAGTLAQVLTSQAYAAIHLAHGPLALAAADEAERFARDTGQGLWVVTARLARATVLAERGELAQADALATEAEAQLLPTGASPILSIVQFVRGRGAVAHQRYEEGYFHLRRMLDPTDTAFQPLAGNWALADLVEAAVNLELRDEATRYLGQLEEVAQATQGSLLHAGLAYARPLVAPDEEAEELYREALLRDLVGWPCFRGRLLLAYGRWLRRQRRVAESRAPLRVARELFDGLGFNALAEAARSELRASGEASRSRGYDVREQLTPQELQIAQLAAAGLTNREIGSRLYLSHRTVSSHLYRLFPKLGISSRSQLTAALLHEDPPTTADPNHEDNDRSAAYEGAASEAGKRKNSGGRI